MKYGDLTIKIYNKSQSDISNNKAYDETINDFDDLNKELNFAEGLIIRLKKLGEKYKEISSAILEHSVNDIKGNMTFEDDIKDAVIFLCKKNDVLISDTIQHTRNTIGNWLYKFPSSTSRDNVYKLCFALEMDSDETKEFFHKYYQNRAFNYKNTQESVYFYCMLNHKDYKCAERIYDEINCVERHIDEHRIESTEQLGNYIESKYCNADEIDFINFMQNNIYDEQEQKNNVINEIKQLLVECKELVRIEYIEILNKYYERNVTAKDEVSRNFRRMIEKRLNKLVSGERIKNTELFAVIYGDIIIINKKLDKSDNIVKKIVMGENTREFIENKMYRRISENFPTDKYLKRIQENKHVSNDVIRKMFIMLHFYKFFETIKKVDNQIYEQNYYEDFFIYLNEKLDEYGMIPLYPRNPYDYFILCCASQTDPIKQLQYMMTNKFATNE